MGGGVGGESGRRGRRREWEEGYFFHQPSPLTVLVTISILMVCLCSIRIREDDVE